MEIAVNGAKQTVMENTAVSQLLTTLNIPAERVVVELNLTILKHAQHPSTVLKEGDQVEIVHFVGGGARNCFRLQASSFKQDASLQPAACSVQRSGNG